MEKVHQSTGLEGLTESCVGVSLLPPPPPCTRVVQVMWTTRAFSLEIKVENGTSLCIDSASQIVHGSSLVVKNIQAFDAELDL